MHTIILLCTKTPYRSYFFFIDEKFHEALKSPLLVNYTEKETDCTESKMDQMVVEGHVLIMHEVNHIKDVHWNGSI